MRRWPLSQSEGAEGGGAKNCSRIHNGDRNHELSVDRSVPRISDSWQYRAVGVGIPMLPVVQPGVVAGSDQEIFERNEPHERLADGGKWRAEDAESDALQSLRGSVRHTLRTQPQVGSGVLQQRSQHSRDGTAEQCVQRQRPRRASQVPCGPLPP